MKSEYLHRGSSYPANMSSLIVILSVLAALAGVWATLQLALLGMYNYQFYQLARRSSERQRQRLGGLLRIDQLDVSPHTLIDWLQNGCDPPVVPRAQMWTIARVHAIVMVVSLVTTLATPHTRFDVLLAVGYPLLVVVASGAVVVIHAVTTELRLWRSDAAECESFYETLVSMDDESFPQSF